MSGAGTLRGNDGELRVLVIDDDPAIRAALVDLLGLQNVPTAEAASPDEGLALIARETFGAVIQDMNFGPEQHGGTEGRRLFQAIRALDEELPVLVMTAWATLEMAVELVRAGAADYVAKPWDNDKLLSSLRTLRELRRVKLDNARLRHESARERAELAARYDLQGLIYASNAMHQVVSLAAHVAGADVSVLITGPNGAGKELLAGIVHANSRRAGKPLVKVNSGGLPDELLEAELFGAEAGAFTGATRQRIGRFEAAHGGTIFLDELGNLSPKAQAKLLRVLQTGEFERLGSVQTHRADVRVVSATNADLGRMIDAGTFREDLYFRLNVIEVRIPALRERPDDIIPLAEHFLEVYAPLGASLSIGPAARSLLLGHTWPGNVRELENRVQRAVIVRETGQILPRDLDLTGKPTPGPVASLVPASASPLPAIPLDDQTVATERTQIESALSNADQVVAHAAAQLGISRQALYRRMERLGIAIERRPTRRIP